MDIIYRNIFLQEVTFCHFISYINSTQIWLSYLLHLFLYEFNTFLHLNIIINKRKPILLIDEYVYSNEFWKNPSIIPCSIDCDKVFRKDCKFFTYHVQQFISERIPKGFCKILYRQSVCVRKIAAAKKCIVAMIVDAHTSKSRWRHTSVCARSRRVEESSKACSSPSARAIFTHTWTCLHLLLHTQRRSGYPCDGACSARRGSRLSMFPQRGSEGKKHLRSFRWIFNVALYISFNNLR